MFDAPDDWLRFCRTLPQDGWDNVMLFTGPEGVGKSTIAWRVLRELDPTFSAARVHFGARAFLANAASTPRGGAVLADEIELNKRRGMHGTTLDLMDFLKDCRALNLHIGFCFPHESLFDEGILNTRVRWKIHIPARGRMVLSERVTREVSNREGGTDQIHRWVERGKWQGIAPNQGPLWSEYVQKKELHMLALGERYAAEEQGLGGGVDVTEATVFFRNWVNEDHRRPRVAGNHSP